MSYLLPHLRTGWAVDQAILNEEDRVVVVRFGHDYDPVCMQMDEALSKIADKVKNFCVVYLVDITEVPDFNTMYELYDPCTVMTFFRNKHIMIDLVLTQRLFRTFPTFNLRRRRRRDATSRRWRLHDHTRVDASRESFATASFHAGHGQQQQDQLGPDEHAGAD